MQTSSSINADIQAWTGSMFESEDLNKKYFSLLTEEAKTLIHSHKLFASIFQAKTTERGILGVTTIYIKCMRA